MVSHVHLHPCPFLLNIFEVYARNVLAKFAFKTLNLPCGSGIYKKDKNLLRNRSNDCSQFVLKEVSSFWEQNYLFIFQYGLMLNTAVVIIIISQVRFLRRRYMKVYPIRNHNWHCSCHVEFPNKTKILVCSIKNKNNSYYMEPCFHNFFFLKVKYHAKCIGF
jgi:hypothetical protein